VIGAPLFEPGTARAVAPSLGEHSGAILRAHGYTEAEIAGLAARRVIGGNLA